ncbi:YdhR family protein [Agrobacterium sp. LAD9]|uniref:YdhR family protein n=1 Tax=Agrobacterium sp. LAD9 TaxID=2055153 RepID=UPI000D1E6C89|nr:YdhR family protein [Agrobacterium sp. LAD9]
MTKAILYWAFDFDFGKNEPFETTLERAHAFENLEGLIWKIWLRDRSANRGGGVYLFESHDTAQAWVDRYKDKPLQPWTSNSHWEITGVDEKLSEVTFAALGRTQYCDSEVSR